MSIYRVPITTTASAAGGPFVNVFHIQTPDGANATTVSQAVSELRFLYTSLTASIANVGPVLAPNMSITADFATEVTTQQQIPVTWTPISTGTFGAYAPTRLAYAISWKSAIAARRARGRTFVGPMQSGVIDNLGLPKTVVRDAVQAAAAALPGAVSAITGCSLVVHGLVTPGGGPKDPHQAYPIVGATTRLKFATLRTRG